MKNKHKSYINTTTLLLISTIIVSCGTVKKLKESYNKTESSSAISIVDTTKRTVSSSEIITSLIEKVDLSKATIIEYSAPDSSGKQSVVRTIEFNNNISTKTVFGKKAEVLDKKENGVSISAKDSLIIEKSSIKKTEHKSSALSLIFYVGIASFCLGIFVFTIYGNKIKLVFKKIISIFVK